MLPALPVHAVKPVIAVFDVEGKNLSSDLRSVLSDYFATRLAASRKYQVMLLCGWWGFSDYSATGDSLEMAL